LIRNRSTTFGDISMLPEGWFNDADDDEVDDDLAEGDPK
jgi:hypothetical protein